MNVLVTGATGFLGSELCRELNRLGQTVTALGSKDCDLRYAVSLEPFDHVKFDRIYHLAAWTQAGDFCLFHPGEQWVINQQINTNILAWWSAKQPQAKLIAIGTSCAYDPTSDHQEAGYLEGAPTESLYTYAMTKRMLYVGLRALHQQFGLCYLCVVPSTLYGPGYQVAGKQLHFIFDLIRKILRGRQFGERVVLWGDGYQKREIVYVTDFVRATVELVDVVANDIVNVGAGEELSIRDWAGMICDEVGFDFDKIEFDQSRYVGARSKRLDVQKLRSLLPAFRMTSPKAGLAPTIDWLARSNALHK